MALGNKGFANLVTGEGSGGVEPRRPPRTGILGARENRLSEPASGGVMTRQHEAVDPAICRIWPGHNRDYEALDETVCADLIASLRAQGRQEVPAIVRRVTGDPVYRFEVICGARRHWSVSWLRAHDYPEFKFIVEPRELADEEAFRLADLENRSRKDLSDYERAVDYARAVERYYAGNQQRMADRLEVSKSWLSRYLELARLPPEILVCFGSPHVIGISHAAALAPLLTHPQNRRRLLTEAVAVEEEQRRLRDAGGRPLPPASVVSRLSQAGRQHVRPVAREQQFKDPAGKVFLKARREGRGGVVFTVPSASTTDRKSVAETIENYLRDMITNDAKSTAASPDGRSRDSR
jgi:ParB family transcriptional regulator, chromosome partitioning protein